MAGHSYEVEVKSLLGSPERAEAIRQAIKKIDPSTSLLSRNKQLNHYFVGNNLTTLVEYFAPSFPEQTKKQFTDLAKRAKTFSVRTRDKDGQIILVIKASVDETTSENGIARFEFENTMNSPSIKTIDDLDRQIRATGFEYQAKWSREREEYKCKDINVTLDKNAGYGWLAEFEIVVGDESEIPVAKQKIAALMSTIGAVELNQDRLARMFDFYNKNWPEYYGTENIFVVE